MRAMLLTEYKNLELTEMPTPEVGEHELLVRVKACGICGSDIHGYDGSSGRRIPPLVMGHEASGEVAQCGDQVTRFAAGDRVTFDSTVSCGQCDYCRRGQINLCDHRRVLGVSCGEYRQHGAFAEYVVVPEHICYRLPDNLPFEHAALIEAVSIAVHAVNRTPLVLGDTAVVVGSGMIGQLVIQTLRNSNCDKIIAVDLENDRLDMARQYGASDIVNANDTDALQRVLDLTNGRGVDVALEVVGATPTVQFAIDSLRKGGSLTLVGNLAPTVELPLQAVVTRELSLYGSCASNGEYPTCIDLMASGKIDVTPLISAVVSLDEGPDWFARLYAKESGLLKVVLQP